MKHSQKALLKATASIIKGRHPAYLSKLMGVPSAAGKKADIFDQMIAAGRVQNFEDAVSQVAQKIDAAENIRLSEIAAWGLDYEAACLAEGFDCLRQGTR